MNKAVQAQELNQLTEHGVSRALMAEAMGMTPREFMQAVEKGDGISANEFLPKLLALMEQRASVGGALEQRRNSTMANQNRAANAAIYANLSGNVNGLDSYFNQFYQGIRNLMLNALPLVKELGEFFESIGPGTRRGLESFGNLLGSIGNIANSLDGVNVELPLIKLTDILNSLSDWFNDIADTIDLVRSDNAWQEKVSGVSTMLVNQLERIAEYFLNTAINTLNMLLPKAMEISNFSFDKGSIPKPTVNLTGVQALLGNINTEINRVNREALKPLLNAYGGVDSPAALPFGPVTDRQGNVFNQTNTMTFNIDGSQQPNEILGTIEDHINNMMRNAAMSNENTEK